MRLIRLLSLEHDAATRTGCRELGVHTLAHDPLQTHACAHEADGSVGESIRPRRHASRIGDRRLTTLPYAEGGSHGEEGLDEGTEEQPCARLCPHPVSNAAQESTEDEGEDGCESLLIGKMEGAVSLARRALEETGEG